MIVFPNAKINIGLDIINKRPDGFHNIVSWFFPIPLYDILEAIPASNTKDIRFVQRGINLGGHAEDNLVVKAFRLLARDYDLPGTDVMLYKAIPPGSGLGGGSSDAAFMLKLLNELYALGISEARLSEYAAQLGSDCSFFLYNRPALIRGRGDVFSGLNSEADINYIVLVLPKLHISTAWAYQHIIPKEPPFDLGDTISGSTEKWAQAISNSFEVPVFERYPELSRVKQKLYDANAFCAGLTGTGAALYGLFKEQPNMEHLGIEFPCKLLPV